MDTHGYPSLRINTHFTLTKVIVYNPKINVLDIGYTSDPFQLPNSLGDHFIKWPPLKMFFLFFKKNMSALIRSVIRCGTRSFCILFL